MRIVNRKNIYLNNLPGRTIQNAVGRDSAVSSEKMTVCFARYSEESGIMEPHCHAEETVVVLDCKNSYVKRGELRDQLDQQYELKTGDVMYFDELEWHVFGYEKGGFLDALCIYGQVDNLRPESTNNQEATKNI